MSEEQERQSMVDERFVEAIEKLAKAVEGIAFHAGVATGILFFALMVFIWKGI